MKKRLLLVAVGFLLLLNSCVKNSEPVDLIGIWRVDKFYQGGNDMTSSFNALYFNYRLKFNSDSTYEETAATPGTPTDNFGSWQMSADGSLLKLTNSADSTVRNMAVSNTTATKMTLKETGSKEYRMVKL